MTCHKEDFKRKQEDVIKRLKEAGISVEIGHKRPMNGKYSSVINTRRKKLTVRY